MAIFAPISSKYSPLIGIQSNLIDCCVHLATVVDCSAYKNLSSLLSTSLLFCTITFTKLTNEPSVYCIVSWLTNEPSVYCIVSWLTNEPSVYCVVSWLTNEPSVYCIVS